MKKRIIKFRGWDNELKRMVSYPHLLFPNNVDLNEQLRCTEYILMQYTGLYDEDGLEIYEGDIVQVTNLDKDYIFDVGFVDYTAPKFVLWNKKKDGFVPIIREGVKSTVIGNIYENPELLTPNTQ